MKKDILSTPIWELTLSDINQALWKNDQLEWLTETQVLLALDKNPGVVEKMTLNALAKQIQDILGEHPPSE